MQGTQTRRRRRRAGGVKNTQSSSGRTLPGSPAASPPPGSSAPLTGKPLLQEADYGHGGCNTACQQCRAERAGTARKPSPESKLKLSAKRTRTVPGCDRLEPPDPRQCAPSPPRRGKQNFVRLLRLQQHAERRSTTTAPRPPILTAFTAPVETHTRSPGEPPR